MSSPRKNLQCMRKNWSFCSCLQIKTPNCSYCSQDSDEEYEYVYTVNYAESKKPPMCKVQIDGNVVEMMIDSGASVNFLDETTFQRINDSGNEMLRPAHNKIY